MKILIATNNKDKYNTISQMLFKIFPNEIEVEYLNKYIEFKEVEEVGTNIERAKGKALNAKNQIKDNYDIILGIDDGIIIDNKEYAAVKEHLFDIVIGDKVKIKDKIYITRAYYLIAKEKENYCYNKIPYILQKKLNSYDNVGYPLNSVISTIEDDKVLTEHSKEELNEYFLKYSKKDLQKLFKDYIN